MAHSPEQPAMFVCTACQTVHAGTIVEHTDSGHEYEAPDRCGACAESEFVHLGDWPHHHD